MLRNRCTGTYARLMHDRQHLPDISRLACAYLGRHALPSALYSEVEVPRTSTCTSINTDHWCLLDCYAIVASLNKMRLRGL